MTQGRTGGLDDAYRELLHAQYPSALVLRDEEGRLLGEGNAPRELVEKERIEWRPSRYPGSRYRHRKPINVSALKQLTRHWEDVLDLVLAARAGFVRRYRLSGPLDVSHLWRLSRFVVTLPNYLSNRAPVRDAPIPAVVAVAFKSTAGIFIVAADMALRGADLDQVRTPEEIIGYADDHGLFGGAFGVCAGPPKMMRDLLQAVVYGPGAESGEAALERLVGDPETFFRYAALYTKLEFTKQVAVCEVQLRLQGMREAETSPDGPPLPRSLIATLERQLRGLEWWEAHSEPALGEVLDESFEKEALRRLASIQREIDDLMGRPRPSRELDEQDRETILGPRASRSLAADLDPT